MNYLQFPNLNAKPYKGYTISDNLKTTFLKEGKFDRVAFWVNTKTGMVRNVVIMNAKADLEKLIETGTVKQLHMHERIRIKLLKNIGSKNENN